MTLQQVDLTQRSAREEAAFRQYFETPVTTEGAPTAVDNKPDSAIEQALQRLQEMTQKMQQAMQEANDSPKEEPPKSLLELLVERFFMENQKTEAQNARHEHKPAAQ